MSKKLLSSTTEIAVVGNISKVGTTYGQGQGHDFLGGAAFHVAIAIARATVPAAPISVVGNDLAWIKKVLTYPNLSLSHVRIAPGQSSSFTIQYDVDGAFKSINSFFGVAVDLTEVAFESIGDHAQYHICCRRPLRSASLLREIAKRDIPFSVDFFLSSAQEMIRECAPYLRQSFAIFANAQEYQMLSSLIDKNVLPCVVVSDGARPISLLRFGSEVATATPVQKRWLEVTGAGDTLAGTFLACWRLGLDDDVAAETAVRAATAGLSGPALPLSGEEDR